MTPFAQQALVLSLLGASLLGVVNSAHAMSATSASEGDQSVCDFVARRSAHIQSHYKIIPSSDKYVITAEVNCASKKAQIRVEISTSESDYGVDINSASSYFLNETCGDRQDWQLAFNDGWTVAFSLVSDEREVYGISKTRCVTD